MAKHAANLLFCFIFLILLSHALSSCSQRTLLIATKSSSCLSGTGPTNRYALYYALDTNGILYRYDPESRSHSALSDSSFAQAVAQNHCVLAVTKHGNLFIPHTWKPKGQFIDSIPKVSEIVVDESMCDDCRILFKDENNVLFMIYSSEEKRYAGAYGIGNFDEVKHLFVDMQRTTDYSQGHRIKVDSALPSSSRWYSPISWEESYDQNFLYVLDSIQEWQSVSVSLDHAIALDSDGNAWAWGANCDGRLGIKSFFGTCTPKKIESEQRWRQVKAYPGSSIAISKDSSLWFWGEDSPDRITWKDSLYTTENCYGSYIPKMISRDPWKSIHQRLAIKGDGSIWILYHLLKIRGSRSEEALWQIQPLSMRMMNQSYNWIYANTGYFGGSYRDIAINDAYQVFALRDINCESHKPSEPLEYLLTDNRYRQVVQLNRSTIVGIDPEGICYEEEIGKPGDRKQVYTEKVANLSEQVSYPSEKFPLVIEFASGVKILHETKQRLDILQYNGTDYKISAQAISPDGPTVYIVKKAD